MTLASHVFSGKLFNGSLFNSGLFSNSNTGFSVEDLFSGGYTGCWLDINDLSLLYTTDVGSTHVAVVSDQIGRAETKSVGVNALQATSSQRPILGQWPSAGRYYAYHDRVDDKLTLSGMPAGTYTIGFASFSGVQVYEDVYSAGTISLPAIDCSELIVINRVLTAGEKANLRSYLSTKTPTIGATDLLRLFCYSSSVNLSVTASGSSSSFTWELGDGQTATGYSCVKTISAPQSVVFRGTLPETVTIIDFSYKNLYGQIVDISKLSALLTFDCRDNQLTGSIPSISANTALIVFRCEINKLTGSIPSLSANTALVTFSCYGNQLTGSIPSLSTNTALATFYCDSNQLTGSIPSISANTALVTFYCHANQLAGYVGGAFPASLGNFDASYNPLTGSAVNAILAGAVAGGRTSASGTCVLNISGTGPAAPTGQGITDKSTLISRGWTVDTN